MNHTFAILPWEYRGAEFNPSPHAHTSLEIAGQRRQFLLKMRDGIIYFKDAKRALLFAIPHRFEAELRGDELIGAWQGEMARENFGRCFARPIEFHCCPGTTVVATIIRPDFSGLITDAFHIDWHTIPCHRDGKFLDIWQDGMGTATWRGVLKVRDSLRDRSMSPGERQSIPSHYLSGNETELRCLFALVMQLYVRRKGADSSRTWKFTATNIASRGGFEAGFSPLYNRDLHISPLLPSLLRLLKQHFVWLAQAWKHHNTSAFRPPQWGDEWRGNYRIVTPSMELTAPLVASLSHHERLELLLQLRDWLEGKVSPRQSANWLSQALD